MKRKIVFISSVQSEFEHERQILFDYLTSDMLLGRFFEPFIFENVPALNTNPSAVFLHEVENCDIYLGIFGENYGFEDANGVSSTEREFDHATLHGKTRLVYVKQTIKRHHKKEKLILKAESVIVRKAFVTPEQLKTAVYASLVNYLVENEFIRTTPFDATLHHEAVITDLNEEKIHDFTELAKRKRNFPFDKDSDIKKILTHLNLIKGDKVTNAALLLFANKPQSFFITSEIKCAHFHGLTVSKPIPSYQVYKGDIFQLIASAVDFVLSKINLYVGDRNKNEIVDVQYELPIQAVTEAIVNAVAHRDYTSNASVQVMLFADRLEVSNPGRLPMGLTIEKLFTAHNSIPANPLLAESLYLYGTIERMGTGTEEILTSCSKMGLKQPKFIQDTEFKVTLFKKESEVEITPELTPQVTPELTPLDSSLPTNVTTQVTPELTPQATPEPTPQVHELLKILISEMDKTQIQESLKVNDLEYIRLYYIQPALKQGLIELVHPYSPNHPKQKYRLADIDENSLTPQVKELLQVFAGEMNKTEIQESLKVNDSKYVRLKYIQPAMKQRLIEQIYPDRPNHPKQRYRLTVKGVKTKILLYGS